MQISNKMGWITFCFLFVVMIVFSKERMMQDNRYDQSNKINWMPVWYKHPVLLHWIGFFVILAIGMIILALI